MGFIFLAFLIGALITYLSIPVIINIAIEKKLVDEPNENRKIHKTPIPSLGGLGVFAGFIISMLLIWPYRLRNVSTVEGPIQIEYVAAATLIIFFLGLKDDILDISALKKFIGQLLAAWLLVYKCHIKISSFYGVFGVYEIPNIVSLCITYLAIVLIINSFNLIDGVDGLSGSLAIIGLIGFGTYFYSIAGIHMGYAYMAAALTGAIGAFLIFNYHPAKIFMGDTGSLLMGLIMSILYIQLMAYSGASKAEISNAKVVAGPVVALSFIFIPLFDTIRVFGMRILKGNSPFSPDRNHIHHVLLDRGFSHKKVTIVLSIAAILIIGLAHLCTHYLSITPSLIITFVAGVAGYLLAFMLPKRIRVIKEDAAADADSKIVNF